MYNVNATIVGGTGTGGATPSTNATQQGTTLLNAAPTTSGANAAATVTVAGVAGFRNTIRTIIIFSSAAGTATLTVQDGATVIANFGTLTLSVAGTVINVLITGTAGNNLVVNIGAAGGAVTTTTSVIADRS